MKTFTEFAEFLPYAYSRATALSGASEIIPIQGVLDEAMQQRSALPNKRRNGWLAATTGNGLIELMNDVADFFRVGGLLARSGGREVAGWKQLIIYGETNGRIMTLWTPGQDPEDDTFWLRIKSEPGNLGLAIPIEEMSNQADRLVSERRMRKSADGLFLQTNVLVSPAFQGSAANIGNHKVPLGSLVKELENEGAFVWTPTPEDGGRFFEKINLESVTSINPERFEAAVAVVPENAPHDFFGAKRSLVRELIARGWLNPFAKRGVGMARF